VFDICVLSNELFAVGCGQEMSVDHIRLKQIGTIACLDPSPHVGCRVSLRYFLQVVQELLEEGQTYFELCLEKPEQVIELLCNHKFHAYWQLGFHVIGHSVTLDVS
jgi:hypothetical protein